MDLPELLEQLGIDYRTAGQHHHVSQGWVGVDCPTCSPHSGKFKCGINTRYLYASCWTCGPKHLPDLLADITGLSWRQTRELLGPLHRSPERRQDRPKGQLVYPHGLVSLRECHKAYLLRRGFEPEALVRLWQVMGIGIAARLAWRLWIPIVYQGKVVSWTTRAISEDNPQRYIAAAANQESVPAKELLYGEDYCRHAVVVCEGPFDVWRIGPGAVATLGTSYTTAQLAKMARYPVRAICFDTEAMAQQRARQLCAYLEPFPGRTTNVLLSAKDPAEAKPEEIQTLRRRFLE